MLKKVFCSKIVLLVIFFFTIINISFLRLEAKNRVLCVGGVTCDLFIDLDKKSKGYLNLLDEGKHISYIAFHEGNKIDVTSLRQYTGGGAGNAAVSLRLLGLESSIFCKMGEDSFAKSILKEFECFRVSAKLAFCDPSCATASSFIIPSESGERTIFVNRGANTAVKLEDFPFDVLKNFDCIYVTALSGKSCDLLLPLLKQAKQDGLLVALNPGISQLKIGKNCVVNVLPFVDILILNETEAAQLAESIVVSGLSEIKIGKINFEKNQVYVPQFLLNPIYEKGAKIVYLSDFVATVLACGPKIVLVTNGSGGAFVGTEDKIFFHSILPTKVFNTIGAGDAFGATFVGSILKGLTIKNAMRYATINSSSVTEVEDAKSGLLTFELIEERSQKIGDDFFVEFLLS